MRFSNVGNNTTVFKKSKRPFEEIMQRRLIREILTTNSNELEFSKITIMEIENGKFSFKEDEDNLTNIQQEIFEELIMRKDPMHIVKSMQKSG